MATVGQQAAPSTQFRSVLFGDEAIAQSGDERAEPDFFHDLNLDQIVAAVTAGREEYRLDSFFYTPLADVEAISRRHEVFTDLENAPVHDVIRAFAHSMQDVRAHVAQSEKLYYRYQKERWHLNAVSAYCKAIRRLADDLTQVELTSRGLTGFRDYVTGYSQSEPFVSLVRKTDSLLHDLSDLRYCLLIRGSRITVGRFDGEIEYSGEVLKTFEKFKHANAQDHRVGFPRSVEMNHVESGIVGLVAKINQELFAALDGYHGRHRAFIDGTVGRFDREIQLYLAYLDYLVPLRDAGLKLCYPHVSKSSKEIGVGETFDLALAAKLVRENSRVVCNDFYLAGPERVLVVSGPNQGGKTTLARTFGQLHHLAWLGFPVPGHSARLFLGDQIFTHFEREEDIATLSGKLEDELKRIHLILEAATPDSVLILNESFTSTTVQDAVYLSTEVLDRVTELDALCVCVTFLDELSLLNEKTVSMVSTVDATDPAVRTYRLVRRAADGRAYAIAIAEKYGLTYDSLRRRIAV